MEPVWLLKMGLAVAAVALFCAYLTVCAVFYKQQWQFVLHPSRTVDRTPATNQLAYQTVRFGDNTAGEPELTGWWISSQLASDPTALVLHGETGSMSDALPAVQALHNAHMNVLLFDYRGYGQSAGKHPSEQHMRQDAESAFEYLTGTRQLHPANVVPYGIQLGASLAVTLAQKHPQIPAIMLQSADGDTLTRVGRETRTRLFPVNLLFHQRFPLADPLHRLQTPKLLLSFTEGPPPEIAQRAADPKLTVELPKTARPEDLSSAIRRFLNTYVAHPAQLL